MNDNNELDYSKLCDIDVDGIDYRDCPDFVDAFISYANYHESDGTIRELTDEELDELNEDGDFVYAQVYKRIYG